MVSAEDTVSDQKEAFGLFDKKGDGKIELKEIGNLLRALGQNPTQKQVKTIIDGIDPEGKQRITFEQFLPILNEPKKEAGTAEDFIEGLKVYDKGNDGTITSSELRHVLTCLGEPLKDDEIDGLLNGIESNKDGSINYEDLVKHIIAG